MILLARHTVTSVANVIYFHLKICFILQDFEKWTDVRTLCVKIYCPWLWTVRVDQYRCRQNLACVRMWGSQPWLRWVQQYLLLIHQARPFISGHFIIFSHDVRTSVVNKQKHATYASKLKQNTLRGCMRAWWVTKFITLVSSLSHDAVTVAGLMTIAISKRENGWKAHSDYSRHN